ncbi:hypothetical protein [Arthrobacter roseus]|uniref:hypothetical protein n=1 Tax=Arthrobacter roseus TaxID=136274 RepID=UPI001964D4C1|nr:hypothetical protein [Arthrobacter roseus]MBM7847092.1 lysylphosphatidylglycerol synthetase-like protein (DUF2156 family) [Arthrobacter roseus]
MTETPLEVDGGPSHLTGGLALACAIAAPILGLLIIGITVSADSATQQAGLMVALILCTALALAALVFAVRALFTGHGRLMAVAALVVALLTNPYSLLFLS